MFLFRKKTAMPTPGQALPGRAAPIATAARHFVFDRPLHEPYPETMRLAMFGMGCFWGAERKFWELGADRIWITAAGYAAGLTPNPTYEEVCSGMTGHNEVVRVVYDPTKISYDDLLRTFWENHDPTQGMRQGNDVGTQYRSGVYVYSDADFAAAERSRAMYGGLLGENRYGAITTEILKAPQFYFAEDYHQQYLAKNPRGYCGLGGTGVSCPIGVAAGPA